jgi:putative oxidoreductase
VKKFLIQTQSSQTPVFLRFTLGLVVLAHGCQSLLGWFGGQGFTATMQFFTDVMELPWIIGFMVICIQFFGALLLLGGLLTRMAAFALFVIFTGMILTSHLDHGFFMNWYGQQQGEGYEYHILVLGICLALMITGGGTWSADGILSGLHSGKRENAVTL